MFRHTKLKLNTLNDDDFRRNNRSKVPHIWITHNVPHSTPFRSNQPLSSYRALWDTGAEWPQNHLDHYKITGTLLSVTESQIQSVLFYCSRFRGVTGDWQVHLVTPKRPWTPRGQRYPYIFSSARLCQKSSWNRNSSVVRLSEVIAWIFFQILVVTSPGPYAQTYAKKLPYAKTSKRYSSLKSLLNLLNLFLNFLLSCLHKSTVLDFWNFKFPILTNFLISSLFPMGKPKTSIISKTSDRRAKQREIWGSGVSIQCTEGTFDTSVIKVILGSFGAFRFLTSLISKMAGRRAKRIEICASGLSIQCTQGTFDT